MKLVLFALLLISQGALNTETVNIQYNEIKVDIGTNVRQRADNYTYNYILENKGQTSILISFLAINKIARPEHVLIELAPNEKKDFTFTSKTSPVRFASKIEIYVPDTQPRYLYNNEGTIDFPKGKFWMLTYGDLISTYLPSNLIN